MISAKILEIATKKPYVVLIGPVGSGKTTLAEKLSSKSNLGTQEFGDSATRLSTVYKAASFNFADTPGYMVMDDKIDHAMNITTALEHLPLSHIFITCKLENRIDLMVRNVCEIFKPLADFKDLTTVIVTFWDVMDLNGVKKTKIETDLKRHLGVSSFLYSGVSTTGPVLEQMMSEKLPSQPRSLSIPLEKTSTYFDITPNELEIMDYIKARADEFQELANDVIQQANGMPNAQEKEDFAFLAQIALKEMIVEYKLQLAEKFKLPMYAEADFKFVEALHMKLMVTLKSFRAFCFAFSNYSKGCDLKASSFRQCPYCNIVWIKVNGCEGVTTCGARVDAADPSVGTNYEWTFVGGIKGMFNRFIGIVKSRRPSKNPSAIAKPQEKGVGCGNKITWKDMKPYPPPPELEQAIVGTDDIEVANTKLIDTANKKLAERKKEVKIQYDL